MRAVVAAAMIALLTVPAGAQFSLGGGGKDDSPVEKEYQQKLKAQAEIDKRYQETVKQTSKGASTPANDPWANIRPAAPAKAAR